MYISKYISLAIYMNEIYVLQFQFPICFENLVLLSAFIQKWTACLKILV